jgi:ADP-heptose:LPS heptosyltransferase
MRALDLVISVDSMPAHLAGALGVPAWTLLPAEADWRWMHGRDDSPWYPTMRLFRQARDGAWEPVIARVAAALEQLNTGAEQSRCDTHVTDRSAHR